MLADTNLTESTSSTPKVNRSWYDQLRDQQWQEKSWIRLLSLQAGNLQDEIVCDMQVVALDTEPQYDALSYCWGSSELIASITVNGRAGFKVTPNLAAALRRVRYANEVRILWVDAICIDQANLGEKSIHVHNMDFIYSKAQEVCIYFGECGLFDYTHEIEAQRQNLKTKIKETHEHIHQLRTMSDASPFQRVLMGLVGKEAELDAYLDCSPSLTIYHATRVGTAIVSQLLSGKTLEQTSQESWWQRLWTVQELVLARNPRVYCGPYVLSWQAAVQMWSRERRQPSASGAPDIVTEIRTLEDVRSLYMMKSLDLHTMLAATSSKSCSNSPDKIFAILGIVAKQAGHVNDTLNYKSSAQTIHSWATAYMIQTSGSFDVLFSKWARSCPIPGQVGSIFGFAPDFCSGSNAHTMKQTKDQSLPCLFRRQSGRWEGARVGCIPLIDRKLFRFGFPRRNEIKNRVRTSLSRETAQVKLIDHNPPGYLLSCRAIRYDKVAECNKLGGAPLSAILDAIPIGHESWDYELDRQPTNMESKAIKDSEQFQKALRLYILLYEACFFHRAHGDCRVEFDDLIEDLIYAWQDQKSTNLCKFEPQTCLELLTVLDECLKRPWSECLTGPLATKHPEWIKGVGFGLGLGWWNPNIIWIVIGAVLKHETWSGTFFVTEKGYLGIGPEATQPGDVVSIFAGARSPYIMRPIGKHYALLGDSFVMGLMHGELRAMEERCEVQMGAVVLE